VRKILFLLILISSFCFAKVYYVDIRNPKANDENPGTENLPWKTLKKAGEVAKAGDTVIVKGGIYRETLDIKNSGEKGKPIVFKAKEGEEVVITGADIVKGWERLKNEKRPIWVKKPWEHKVWARGKEWKWRAEQVIVDDNLYDQCFSLEEMKPGSFFWDNENKALYLWLSSTPGSELKESQKLPWWESPVNFSSEDPNQHMVEVSLRGICIKAIDKNYIHIKGFHIKYCANQAQRGAIGIGGNNNIVEDCLIEFTNGVGITFGGENVIIRNNITRYNGEAGAGCSRAKNLLFEGNILLRNNYKGHSHGWEGGGIKLVRTEKAIIRGNKFIENNGPGLWFDWGNRGFIIEKNLCLRNIGSGIMVEVSPETKESYKGPFKPGIIRNNISAFNRFDGTWGSGILLQLASYTYVLNNTVYGNEMFGIFLRYHPYANYGGGKDGKENVGYIHTLKNNVIMNNICANNGGYQIYITPDPKDKPGAVKNNICDYNLFWDEKNWNFIEYATRTRVWRDMSGWSKWGKTQANGTYSVEEWFKITGYDEHSIQWDPKFVSPETFDFRLLPGSIAIGRGKKHKFVVDDFFGNPRPKDRNPSMGAIEFYLEKKNLTNLFETTGK